MFQFTGHPLRDIGVAALTALADCRTMEDLTEEDLRRIAAWLEDLYTGPGPMRNFARGAVFHNAGYTSSPDPAKQHAHADRVLRSWRSGTTHLPDRCAFCGNPAAYRASRQDLPLLNGAAVFNFSPAGRAGLPICGLCSLAFQALPLACAKSSGGLIAAHSEDQILMLAIARQNVRKTLAALTLSEDSLPGFPHHRTRLIEMLIDWLAHQDRHAGSAASLTGYFFSNNGTSPFVYVYPLSSAAIGFLENVSHNADGMLTVAWNRAVAKAWVAGRKNEPTPEHQANQIYERLLGLPDSALALLRRHLMPVRHWGLVALFLTRIMGMEQERIDLLRTIGERIAEYVQQQPSFFYKFSREDVFAKWRRLLLRAVDDYARQTGRSLITFDEFASVFLPTPDGFNDWRLARDLVTLALINARVGGIEMLFPEDSDADLPDESADSSQADHDTVPHEEN